MPFFCKAFLRFRCGLNITGAASEAAACRWLVSEGFPESSPTLIYSSETDTQCPNEAVAGSNCSFTVVVKDKDGNKRPAGGDIVVARLVDRASGLIAAQGHVVDNTDGTYYVCYVPTHCGTELSLRVTVNGSRLKESPFRPRFVPGPIAGRCCTASGAGLHDGVTGALSEFKLQARAGPLFACGRANVYMRVCTRRRVTASAMHAMAAAAASRWSAG